ncbi:MAG: pentapeptide repeat-containing protein [Polyangiales bacterium]
MSAVDPSVALGLRRALTSLRAHAPAVSDALDGVRDADGVPAQRAAAMDAGMRFSGLAHVGELVSRPDDAREALILASTDAAPERAHALALSQKLAEPVVFRAFRHVFPYSFRSATLDAWERYEAHLTARLDQPVWPDRAVSLRALYVPPACVDTLARAWPARADDDAFDADAARDAAPTRPDPLPALLEKLFAPDAPPVLALEGEPGLGRSTVALVLADHLAREGRVAPLLVQTRALRRDLPLLEAVRAAFAHTAFHGLLDDLRGVPPRVLILDLEVPPTREQLAQVALERARGTLAGALLVRPPTTPWDEEDRLDGVELRPFDDPRARTWAARWNAHTQQRFDVESFLRTDPYPDAEEGAPPLNLSRQPLTLILLAEMAAQGHALQGTSTQRDRAEVYREIITWRCRTSAPGVSPRPVPARERDALRRAARALHRRRELDPSAEAWGALGPDEIPPSLRAEGGSSWTFPLVVRGGRGGFYHDSFADYLLAEDLALGAARLTAAAGDVDGDDVPALSAPALVAAWLDLVGGVTLSAAVAGLLDVMLPGWENCRGARGVGRGFREAWRRTVATLYAALLDDGAFHPAWLSSSVRDDAPERVRARALWALLRLASFPQRRAERFDLAPDAPRDLVRLTRILEGIPDALPRCHDRVSLARARLDGARLDGVQLANLDLAGATLRGATLAGADLVWCNLAGATLRDARLAGARLDRACLDGADLRRARLDGASLVGASLKRARLGGASLRGVALSDAQRAEAAFTDDDDDDAAR